MFEELKEEELLEVGGGGIGKTIKDFFRGLWDGWCEGCN